MEPKIILSGKQRAGKGFSRQELKKAGLDLRAQKKYNLRIDKRRKTAYEENVKLLKERVAEEKKKKAEATKKRTKKKKAKPKESKKEEK
jgi:large subunit ribosomal protein L13e